jgi:aminoglycoside phosphotransferase (APT) family kinase protein
MEGIAAEPVTAWIQSVVEGLVPPLDFQLVAGGRSNLTYRVTDSAGRMLALRRPPLSHVLPTAHDMGREHRVLAALGPTSVPVPRVHGLCTDSSVNGAPFYVMDFVDGAILRDASHVQLDLAARRNACESFVDVLARLHAVDVRAVGLGDLARHEGYIERQLRRWNQQFDSSQVDDGIDNSVVSDLGKRLAAGVPEQVGVAVVHGDYRLDNVVLAPDGTVLAVLDWEICTLGDPLADLGLLMVYWAEAGEDGTLTGVAPTAEPGFMKRAEIRERYATISGRDLSSLDFYTAFGFWKLACILQGVYHRYAGGAAAGDRSSVEAFGRQVVELAEFAMAVLDGEKSR